jgi:hypothetical protein
MVHNGFLAGTRNDDGPGNDDDKDAQNELQQIKKGRMAPSLSIINY